MTHAIVAFPKIDNVDVIEQLRAKYDPLAKIIPAHITLVFPFESQINRMGLQRHVEKATEGMKPFFVELQKITPVGEYLFLNLRAGKSELVELHERLYFEIQLAKEPFLEQGFVPHITIGRVQDKSTFRHALEEMQKVDTIFQGLVSEVTVCRIDRLFEKELSVLLRG